VGTTGGTRASISRCGKVYGNDAPRPRRKILRVTTLAPDGPGSCLAALNLPGPPIIESKAQLPGYPAMTATRQAFNPAEGDLPTMERKNQTAK
jgi:hypothetical protein